MNHHGIFQADHHLCSNQERVSRNMNRRFVKSLYETTVLQNATFNIQTIPLGYALY